VKEHLFFAMSMVANVLAYGGCIGQSKSDCKIWKIVTVAGQAIGAMGLFFILVYFFV
jgi:hypothetical protein